MGLYYFGTVTRGALELRTVTVASKLLDLIKSRLYTKFTTTRDKTINTQPKKYVELFM